MSIYLLASIPFTNVLQASCNNLDIAKTTVSQNLDGPKEKYGPVRSPNDSATVLYDNNSVTTIEPHPFHGSGDLASIENSTTRVEDETAEDNTQAQRDDNSTDAEMSAPQPLSTPMDTQVPDWLKKMLVYLWGVSDNMEWQDLVSALLKFENLNPPSGVGAHLLNLNFYSNLICFSL